MTIDHAEQLRQLILLRFAKTAKPKVQPAAETPKPPAQPGSEFKFKADAAQEVPNPQHFQPVGSGPELAVPSPMQTMGQSTAYVGKEKTDYAGMSNPTSTQDASSLISPSAGRHPGLNNPDAKAKDKKKGKKEDNGFVSLRDQPQGGGDLRYALQKASGVGAYGQVQSEALRHLHHHLGVAADRFDCIRRIRDESGAGPDWASKYEYLSQGLVSARKYQLRLKLSDPNLDPAEREQLQGEYASWTKALADLKKQGEDATYDHVHPDGRIEKRKVFDANETSIPSYLQPDGSLGYSPGTSIEERAAPQKETKEDIEKWGDTEHSKRFLELAGVGLNQQLTTALRMMREEIKAKHAELPSHSKMTPEQIREHNERLETYHALEAYMSAAELGGHAVAQSANDHMRNFAPWYPDGSAKAFAEFADMVNSSPIMRKLHGAFGHIVGNDQEGYRHVISNAEQAGNLQMLATLMAPTSSNETPDANFRIAAGVLEDGLYQWTKAHQNNPEKLATTPTVIELLSHAQLNRGHLGEFSPISDQSSVKYLTGMYQQLRQAAAAGDKQASKALDDHHDLFAYGIAKKGNRTVRDAATKKERLVNRQELEKLFDESKPVDALYHLADDGKHKLVPLDIKGEELDDAYADAFINGLKIKAGPEFNVKSLRGSVKGLLAHAKKMVGDDHQVGYEPGTKRGRQAFTRGADGSMEPLGKSLMMRPGSVVSFLNFTKMMNVASEEAARLHATDGMTPDQKVAAVASAIVHHGKKGELFDQLGIHEDELKNMFPGVKPEDIPQKHAENLARLLLNNASEGKAATAAAYWSAEHDHGSLAQVTPLANHSYVAKDPQTGNLRYFYAQDPSDPKKTPGFLREGSKFGPYGQTTAASSSAALNFFLGKVHDPAVKYVADRVMSELHSDALGKHIGGVPNSDMQRAYWHHGVDFLGSALANAFGYTHRLPVDHIQAICWASKQAYNSALGADNPTEQLHTGAEQVYAVHKLHARRMWLQLKDSGDPHKRALAEECRQFYENAVPLHVRSQSGGLHYGNFAPMLHMATPDGGVVPHGASSRAQAQTMLGSMAGAGQAGIDALVSAGKERKMFSRSAAHGNDGAGSGDRQRLAQGRRTAQKTLPGGTAKPPRAGGGGDHGVRKAPVPPVPALHGKAPQPAQRRHATPARRDGQAGRPVHDVPAGAGAGPVKYSSQFMRSMLLGTSATSQKFREQLDGIARQLGVELRSYNGVGDATSSTSPATAHLSAPIDPDRARYLAAWAGLLGNRQSVLMFHPDPRGTDAFYSIKMPETNMMKVRAALDKRGIKHRTIIPGGNHTHIMVYDPQQVMRAYVAQLGDEHDAHILESRGRAEFIGRPTNGGGGTDPVADAREHYRRIIADYEERHQQNPAGAAADGDNSGASVSGAGAGRSPAGGSIVRGITYKGGKFTPAAEQKAPPAPQPGSPARFRRKFNKSKSLAEQGSAENASAVEAQNAKHEDAFIDLAYGVNGVAQHHRGTGGISRQMQGNVNATLSPSSITATGDAPKPSYGTSETEPDKRAVYLAAHQGVNNGGSNVNHQIGGVPVALATQVNALRHAIACTAAQGISAHQRYADYVARSPRFSGTSADGLQKLLGAACAGRPKLLQGLINERRRVNHDVQLSPGVTQLGGVITPYSDSLLRGEFKVRRHDDAFAGMKGLHLGDTYVPQDPAQYGLIDYLDHARKGSAPVYGTPDGRLFLDPMHANLHVAKNPHLLALKDIAHEPWHHIERRVSTFSRHDDLINAIASDDELANAEEKSHKAFKGFADGIISLDGGYAKSVANILRQEPARYRRLLSILHRHFGGEQAPGAMTVANGMMDVGAPGAALGDDSGLGITSGARNTGELADMAGKMDALFARVHPSQPSQLGVHSDHYVKRNDYLGSYEPMDHDTGVLGGVMRSGQPAGVIKLSKMATPAVMAHEVAHHAAMNLPGIERAVYEKMFAPGVVPNEDYGGRGNIGFMAHLDTNWASGDRNQSYARKIMPVVLLHRGNMQDDHARAEEAHGHLPILHNAAMASEYFPMLVEEFFQRPVRMCREYPHMARLLLGLMSGALRSHQ